MKKPGNIISLELLAASQWGMFTTAQAQELGIRRNQVFRMVSALRVEPISSGSIGLSQGHNRRRPT